MNNEVNNNSKIIIVILAILLIAALGFICYDKFINKENHPVSTPLPMITPSPTPTDSIAVENTIVIDETIKLKEISIPNSDEEINLDYVGHNYLIQIKNGHLFINNEQIIDSNNDPVSAQTIYVTNQYILFTEVAQDLNVVSYAINKDGNKINIVDNNYQIHNLVSEGNYIKAKGHIFCGLDGNCPDKDLIIKYENNTITVIKK